MATIKWNSSEANTMLTGTSPGQIVFSGNPAGVTALTQVLGSPNVSSPASVLFIFKGTMPSDFSTVSNISSQSGNLLVAIPTFGAQLLGSPAGSDSIRFLTGQSGNTYIQAITSTAISGANLVVTQANHSFIPGQTVTISGTTGGTNVNANWVVESTPNSSAWITTASSGSNGTASGSSTGGNCAFSYTAQGSGTASWFILARWNGGTSGPQITTSTALSGFGALMGNIGVTNSGSDLEIPNTTITSGSTYSSAGFYLNWPLTWTV